MATAIPRSLDEQILAHIVNCRELLRKSAEPLEVRIKAIDKMTRSGADILRADEGPLAESLRRDIFELRDRGRLLKKAHTASKSQPRRLGARVFDIDSDSKDV